MRRIILLVLFSNFVIYNCTGQSLDSISFTDNGSQKTVTISFKVLKPDVFSFYVYSRSGNLIFGIYNDTLNPGYHSITKGISAGVYVYFISSQSQETKRKGIFAIKDITTSIRNIEDNTEINIYPNPSNGILSVSYSTATNCMVKLVIYTPLGEIIYATQLLAGNKAIIDAGTLPKGIYIVQLQDEYNNTIGSKKLVLQ